MLAKKTPVVVPPPPRKHGVQVPARQPPPKKHGVHVPDGHRMMISDIGYGPRSPYLPHVLAPCKYPKPSSKPAAKPTAKPTDWKDWKTSPDWSSHCTWNSWNSKEKMIQDERVEHVDYPIGQWSNSLQKWEDEKWDDEKTEKLTSNSWNSKEKWIQDERVEHMDYPIGQWFNSLQKWEDEKWEDEKTKTLTWNSWNSKEKWMQDEKVERNDYPIGQWFNSLQKWEDEKTETEPCCHEVDDDEYEIIREEEDNVEVLIKRTREVLQRHRGEAPVHRSGKRGRSPLTHELSYPPPKKSRKRRGGKAVSKSAKFKARDAKPDDNGGLSRVHIRELRYSQFSCKDTFQCGRSVSQLVQGLLDRKVGLSAPFLHLTVFETTDDNNEPILRCIDNRRLFALKTYAEKSGKYNLMVNVHLFNQNTLTQVRRFIRNSDDTDGRDVRSRKTGSNKRRGNRT